MIANKLIIFFLLVIYQVCDIHANALRGGKKRNEFDIDTKEEMNEIDGHTIDFGTREEKRGLLPHFLYSGRNKAEREEKKRQADEKKRLKKDQKRKKMRTARVYKGKVTN